MSLHILTPAQQQSLLHTLQSRFEQNKIRHQNLDWARVQTKLTTQPDKLWSLSEMERTGGEPDVVGFDDKTGEFIFYDCSSQSPLGRRSTCYDQPGQDERVKQGILPSGNAIEMARLIGIEILDEEQYQTLQKLGEFDTKTSSWLKTPPAIRQLGGAIFADRRYDHVFVYHNGAQSFYAARGFRGQLQV